MTDFCPIRRVDHLELYVGNAKQAAAFYSGRFGFAVAGYRGLETGSRHTASFLMTQGDIRFVLTAPLTNEDPVARFVYQHGDGVAVIALEVPDARRLSTRRRSAEPLLRSRPSRWPTTAASCVSPPSRATATR